MSSSSISMKYNIRRYSQCLFLRKLHVQQTNTSSRKQASVCPGVMLKRFLYSVSSQFHHHMLQPKGIFSKKRKEAEKNKAGRENSLLASVKQHKCLPFRSAHFSCI